MITQEKLIKLVGQRFWKHIHRETELSYDTELEDRKIFLDSLYKKINKMRYSPSPPRGILVSRKENLVARFIPALTKEDYCVYFYCLKCIEPYIAENRVAGTYGGWRLGGKLRVAENTEDSEYGGDNSYNKFAWKSAWTDFQKRAYQFYKSSKFKYFIYFDIANFYDSVRLDRLEMLTREAVNKQEKQIVNLLFYFLTHWNKKYLYYERQSTGLPQDEVGDCSRILANFYLQDYDQFVRSLVKKNKSGYLRFADDQIIGSTNEKTAREILFLASKELAKIGLNLNAAKAKFFTRKEFFQYWSFDIFTLLEKSNNKENINKGFSIFQNRKKAGIKFKPDSVLRRLLGCDLSKISPRTRNNLINYLLDESFLTNISGYYLGKIYNLLNEAERKSFILKINKLSEYILFNHFHLRVLKFSKENKIENKFIKVSKNLEKINKLLDL